MPTTLDDWLEALRRAHHRLPALEHIVWPGPYDVDGRPVSVHGADVHRLIWAHLHRTPRPAFRIEAACDEPACIRPSHLQETPTRPIPDKRYGLTTHCLRGHDLTDWRNAYWTLGRRRCRLCDRTTNALAAERLRARIKAETRDDTDDAA